MNADTAMKIISMVEACAIWAAIFVVFFFITKAVGMTNNLPKEIKKRLAELNKFNETFIAKMSDEKEDKEKDLVEAYKKLKKLERITIKICSVYSYDHPLNIESTNALDTLQTIHNECQKVSVAISRKKYEEIEGHLKAVTLKIAEADKQIDKLIEKDEEEKILHA